MSTKPRIRRSKEIRIQEILCAARQIFTQKGYADTAMADIASKVGVVEGAIYRHFESKRDLLNRVLMDFYADTIEDIHKRLPGIEGVRNRLYFLIWRHFAAFAEDPGYFWLLLREVRPDKGLYGSAIRDCNRRYTAFMLQVLEEGVRKGEFRTDMSPLAVRDMIYGGIEHIMWRHHLSGTSVDVTLEADALTDMIIRGIVSQAVPVEIVKGLTCHLSGPVGRLELAAEESENKDTR